MGKKVWTEDEIAFLVKYKNRNATWIAKKLGKTRQQVADKIHRMGISNRGKWTKEQIDFLKGTAGEISVGKIAKRLGRSKGAVKQKCQELGLSIVVDTGNVSFNTIIKEFGYDSSYAYLKEKWQSMGLKIEEGIVNGRKCLCVDIPHFIKWAEEHKEKLDFRNLEHNAFGIEPEWMKNKIEADRRADKNKNNTWTDEEKDKLISMTKNGLDIFRISMELNRSHQAIMTQIHRLNIPYRPVTPDAKKWTEEETETLIKMREHGESFEVIAFAIGKSYGAVKRKYSRCLKEKEELQIS